jgi:hypothetical protein
VTGISKVMREKATEIAALGFYKNKNRFESAQDVFNLYNKTFQKASPVETEVLPPSCKWGSIFSGYGTLCHSRGY